VFVFIGVIIIGCAFGAPCGQGISNYYTPDGLCAWIYRSGLANPRSLVLDALDYILVVESGAITSLFDLNQDGIIQDNERWQIAVQSGLNHGLVIHGGFLYASTATTVYRWKYTDGTRTSLGSSQVVISGIPSGGHNTRTLLFQGDALFIAVGSASNVDSNSNRARVVKCTSDFNSIPNGGYSWTTCEVWNDGTRNEVGLRLDPSGRLWGVENGVDNLQRQDLGGDIHNNNPSEEFNLLEKKGFYGYPYCWSAGILAAPNEGPGVQWAHPNFINDGTHTDSWCKNTNNVIPPVYNLGAHTAPLDLIWHNFTTFPAGYQTGVLVSEHGSWNRSPSSGFQVVAVSTDSNHNPIAPERRLLGSINLDTSWVHRPVGLLRISPCGPAKECLLVSSDESGVIIAVASNSTTTY